MAAGEVGRVGVASTPSTTCSSCSPTCRSTACRLRDHQRATAAILLALYVAVARQRGIPAANLSGTVQNDILKEYIARGTYIYPPVASIRIVTDLFAWLPGGDAALERHQR